MAAEKTTIGQPLQKMKRVSIYNNFSNNHKHRRNRVINLLKAKGFVPMSNGDLVVVIGGDGTFLSAVKERIKDNPVFVALNSGNLGYFSEFDFNDVKKFVDTIASEEYRIVEYPIYEVELLIKNSQSIREYFINDAVIEKKSAKMIHLKSTIDNKHSYKYASDGLIISSSLGSTAYSMNAGGAMTPYQFPLFQMTPLLQSRYGVYEGVLNPILLKDDSVIEITPDYKVRRAFRISVDGKEIKAKNVQSVRIYKTAKTFKVLRTKDFDELSHMNKKLF